MRILITNDDGLYAEGIATLARKLNEEHDVVVVAPNTERSGASHSLTYMTPLFASRAKMPGCEEIEAYHVNGTPADCAKLGLGNLVSDADIVVSGINHGLNMGTDVQYSGTVNAAMEAAMIGCPAIALSIAGVCPKNIATAAQIGANAIKYAVSNPIKPGHVLNVNVPDLPLDQLKGTKITTLCVNMGDVREYTECLDPYGRKYYWISNREKDSQPDEGSDVYWTMRGYVTLTMLKVDNADHDTMQQMLKKGEYDLLAK